MDGRWKTALRWVLVGLAVFLLVRSSSGGCSTLPGQGEAAPAFTLPDAGGRGAWSLESFGGTPVALVFFATWCPSCREELPDVVRVLKEAPGARVLLVSDEEAGHVGEWLRRRGYEIPAAGRGGETWRAYGVRSVPSVVLVDAQGKVELSGQGAHAVKRALDRVAMAAGASGEGRGGEAGPRRQ